MSEWTDIGEQLREARQSKGLELRDVSHTTRIPLATLEALEESDYSIFPSPTYARSFLAQYSEFLEVDAHEWIDAFETGDVLSNINDHGYLQDNHDHIGDSNPQPVSKRRTSKPSRSKEEKISSGGTSMFQTLTVFLITALLIGGGIYAYNKYEHILTGGISENDETGPAEPDTEISPGTENKAAPEEPKKPSTKIASTHPGKATGNQPTPEPSLPPGVTPSTKPKDDGNTPKTRIGPPPKAMVIEEEDE